MVEQGEVLNEFYASQLKICEPRPELIKYTKPGVEEIRIRDTWKFEESLFSNYIQDDDALINKWFEFDWELVLRPKFTGGIFGLVEVMYRGRKAS